jgi:hypothetical protein
MRKDICMKTNLIARLVSLFALCLLGINIAMAGTGSAVWDFNPLTETRIEVASNNTAVVRFVVTNRSNKSHALSLQPIHAVRQVTTGTGLCGNPAVLAGHASCILHLQINGSELIEAITGGPVLCESGPVPILCFHPSLANILHVTQGPAITDAPISITDSPLTLTRNGSAGTLTVTNDSLIVAATNVVSDFAGTALDGNVTETGNTCANLAPQATCTLTYTPGSSVVTETDFTIQGDNTNAAIAAIDIESDVTLTSMNPTSGAASGGTGVTLTGTGFTTSPSVQFDGVNATSINFINSTTITAVTPTHAVGAVDVVVTLSAGSGGGSATLTNGYTYLTTAVGQSAFGGTIACLASSNTLIAATTDNSSDIDWGSNLITTGATSTTDGASNTTAIIGAVGQTTPNAAQLCNDYEVDSLGNTPCELGNTCYNDWFLPAGRNLGALGQLNCLYQNRVAIGGFSSRPYWSSIENNIGSAWFQNFSNGAQNVPDKSQTFPVRCVRAFTP